MDQSDAIFKQKYQKYKLRVKIWENDFKKRKGRIPSKYDIREAPEEIRQSYKMYYKLKTSFLEDTLNDVLSEDGFDLSTVANENDLNDTADLAIPQLPLDISAIMGNCKKSSVEGFSNMHEMSETNKHSKIVNINDDHVIKQFEATDELPSNTKAWGESVTNCKKGIEATVDEKIHYKSNLNKKLFKSSPFSMRNPRKSLSRNSIGSYKSTPVSENGNDTNHREEVLPDLELILLQKAKEQQNAAAIVGNSLVVGDKTKVALKMNVDKGWLERTATENGLKMKPIDYIESKAENKSTYGLSNIDVTKIKSFTESDETATNQLPAEPILKAATTKEIDAKRQRNKITSDSDSAVPDSDEEGSSHKLRHIAKKRRLQNDISTNKAITQCATPNPIQRNETTKPLTKGSNHSNGISIDNHTTEQSRRVSASVEDQSDKLASLKNDSVCENENYMKNSDKNDTVPDTKGLNKSSKWRKTTVARPKIANRKKASTKKSPKTAAKKTIKPSIVTKSTQNSNRQKICDTKENSEESESNPLDPEELKYTIALDSGELRSVPRVKSSELQCVQALAERYINTIKTSIAPSTSKETSTLKVDEKRAAERRKLEEKIASGRLNENYRTINIQKKLFVRGKKTVNFSKYKKKQWRDKKRVAALTGPDMDMGGCDGGVLRCFSCGQTGHFAQQCKVKGDALLPLSAQLAIDPSPFPTLEEAEQMAIERAVVVHSRNIAKLPSARNTALYRDLDQETDELSVTHAPEKMDETKSLKNANLKASDSESIESDKDEDLMESDEEFDAFDVELAISEAHNAKAVDSSIPDELLQQAGLSLTKDGKTNTAEIFPRVGALYELDADGSVKSVTAEVLEVLNMFGHNNFRKGQDRAIMRILSGLSTLVTLSTGSGKSLCYQLPAYLYSRLKQSITLVISPLVSLMEDQVTGVPHFLRAHCLHTNQTPQQRAKIMKMISNGEVDILLVSPEAVVAGERSTGFGSILRQLPPIAFACIDEAHCVSQWSHNFRPSYLMICKVLRQNLGVHTILGLTATATLPTRLSIINHLGIMDGERGVISDVPLPENLILSVSKDEHRDAALLQLLNSKRFSTCHSIIIYCTRRDECERIATFLRTSMQDQKVPTDMVKKRKSVNWHAEPYHAGMPSSRRRTIQNAFMRNELRIVVATIAFGMGINKPDIRSVIHYNMPRNFESYVQEIGRAGRDGHDSHCHMFIDAHGNDQTELRRHIYANSIDRHVIRKLLQQVFVPCACAQPSEANKTKMTPKDISKTQENQRICSGHEISFSIKKTVETLDIPEENISTLLCYLELEKRWNIKLLSSAYIMGKIISYGGAKYLKYAAKDCAPLAMAIALQIKQNKFDENANIIEFSVIEIASAIGWNSGVVKYQLKNLEWVQINGLPQRSPINVTFYDLGFRLCAPGDFAPDEIDDALDTLYSRAVKQEETQLIQLQYVFKGLSSIAYNSYMPCTSENYPLDRSNQLKGLVRDYFHNDYPKDYILEVEDSCEDDSYVVNDINAIINLYPDNNFTGRTIARIFHGISSPNYPAVIWGRCKYWRVHCKKDFNRLVRLANAIIIQRRT